MEDFRLIDVLLRPITIVVVSAIGVAIWMIRWFAKHDEWRKGMDEFKRDTKSALVEIRDDIKKILAAMPKNVLAGTSPVRLTDLGEEVSESIGAAVWAEEKASEFVDGMKGKSAYEVQGFCIDYMRNEYAPTTDEDLSFKECAYEHGIKLEQVLDVCALESRDRLLRLLNSGTRFERRLDSLSLATASGATFAAARCLKRR